MPLVGPLDDVVPFVAIPFLDFADKLVLVPFNLLQIIIIKLVPLLFEFTLELHPSPLELVSVHRFFSSRCSIRCGSTAGKAHGNSFLKSLLLLTEPDRSSRHTPEAPHRP